MAVTEQDYQKWVEEVAAGDEAVRTALMQHTGNESFRDRSAGGSMRHADYTHKTKQLAADRKLQEQKLGEYETALQDAEGKMSKVMDDLAKEKIDRATADARLDAIKTRWDLKDEDLPTGRERDLTQRIGQDVTKGNNIDIDARLTAFRADLLKELQPAINRMTLDAAAMDTVWDDIRSEHQELFGKRLTGKEQVELMHEFQKLAATKELPPGVTNIPAYWEHKFGVSDKRTTAHESALEKKFRDKWEAEQTDRRSKEMLDGMRGEEHPTSYGEGSPVFAKQFKTYEDSVESGNREKPTEDKQRPTLVKSGADRAAERFLDRRAKGVGLGQPDPAKKTA
jgi:hypothetical protein